MAMYDNTKTAPMGSVTTFRIVNLFDAVMQAFHGWRTARATGSALGKLSNAQLRDIGLERGDIADISRRLAGNRF